MFAEPEAAASEEAAAVEEAATEAAAVELEEPPQAVRTPAAPTTADALMKSRREIIFIILFSFIRISQHCRFLHNFMHFLRSVCIITAQGTVRNRTNHQESEQHFVNISQLLLLYPRIFLVSSTIFHESATCVQIFSTGAEILSKLLQTFCAFFRVLATIFLFSGFGISFPVCARPGLLYL